VNESKKLTATIYTSCENKIDYNNNKINQVWMPRPLFFITKQYLKENKVDEI
jgi:hypothetical protein